MQSAKAPRNKLQPFTAAQEKNAHCNQAIKLKFLQEKFKNAQYITVENFDLDEVKEMFIQYVAYKSQNKQLICVILNAYAKNLKMFPQYGFIFAYDAKVAINTALNTTQELESGIKNLMTDSNHDCCHCAKPLEMGTIYTNNYRCHKCHKFTCSNCKRRLKKCFSCKEPILL